MEYILDSVRRIIARWVSTQTVLTVDAEPGDTILTVNTSNRFRENDEVIIRNSTQGETPVFVDSILDETHIQISDPVRFRWEIDDNSILEKMFNQNMVQGIYLGDPDVIPRYPAITVTALNRSSEWLTLGSTQETYNIQIAIYVRDSNQEGAYRFLLQMVDTIQKGLKQNIYPLVGPYNTTTLKADISSNDTFIKVNDISLFEKGSRINIEDRWKVEEFMVQSVVDFETLQLDRTACYSWNVSDNTQVIKLDRFFFNSWPATIDYGKIFKGTMLKAATIDWFAWEELIQNRFPRETSIL